jgi:hypothetical protein
MRCPRCAAPVAVRAVYIDTLEPYIRIECWCEAGNRAGTHDPIVALYLVDGPALDDDAELAPTLRVTAPILIGPASPAVPAREISTSDRPPATPPGRHPAAHRGGGKVCGEVATTCQATIFPHRIWSFR